MKMLGRVRQAYSQQHLPHERSARLPPAVDGERVLDVWIEAVSYLFRIERYFPVDEIFDCASTGPFDSPLSLYLV